MHSSAEPQLSAIVVIPDEFETVQATLRALQAQTAAPQLEIVFVMPAPPAQIPREQLEKFHSFQIVVTPFVSITQGYAQGVRHARAPLVVFTEDHSFPAPNWAARLIAAHAQPYAAVGVAIRNGNPDTLTSWGDFFIAYGKWAEPLASGEMDFLPGHNSSYKRAVLLEYGARLEDMLDAETLLHWDLRAQGYKLWLEATTYTRHLNFTMWQQWIETKVWAGRLFGARRAASWSFGKRFAYVVASPLIPFVRFWRIRADVVRVGLPFRIRLGVYATLAFGLALDSIGQALGYAFGMGNTASRSLDYEFHRVRYIKPISRGGVDAPA